MTPCDFSADIVCVAEPYRAATEMVAMWRIVGSDGKPIGSDGKPIGPDENAISRLGVRILDLQSDNIIEVSTHGMSQRCENGLCAYYIRSCTNDKLTCRYVVATALRSDLDFKFVPREFEIVARSVEEYRAAAASIHIGFAGVAESIAVADLQDEQPRELLRKYSAWSVN